MNWFSLKFASLLLFVSIINTSNCLTINQPNQLKSAKASLKIQQQIIYNQERPATLQDILSFYLSEDERELLLDSSEYGCIDDMYDIENLENNEYFLNVVNETRSEIEIECGDMNLTDDCYDSCLYYNNPLGWIEILLNGTSDERDIVNYMIQLYRLSAGPMSYYDAGNPDMCAYSYGTYCFAPAMLENMGMSYTLMQHACCLPNTCKGQDAERVLKANSYCYGMYAAQFTNDNGSSPIMDIIMDVMGGMNMADMGVEVHEICEPMKRELDDFGPQFVIAIFMLCFAAVIMTSIAKQYLMEYKGYDDDSSNKVSILISSFNVQNTWTVFRSVRPEGKREYNFLDGIRVWSMSWVVFGHSFMNFLTGGASNAAILMPQQMARDDYGYVISDFYMIFAQYATYAVDTFFFLSGFLGAFSIYRALQKYSDKTKAMKSFYVWIPMSYLARILRIVPIMMFITAIQWQLSDQIPYGYHVTSRDNMTKWCGRTWYKILLFYANIETSESEPDNMMCMPHLWYIQCDMQMYLLLPWILLCFTFHKFIGLFAALVPVIVCLIFRFVYAWDYGYSANFIVPVSDEGEMNWHYFKPWTRMSPYFTGVFLMLAIITIDSQRKTMKKHAFVLSKSVYFVCLLLGCLTMLVLVVAPYDDVEDAPNGRWDKLQNNFYWALSCPVWGFGLALMTFAFKYKASDNGQKSFIQAILSMEVYQPMGKLTFLMYLVHMLVYDWWVLDAEQPLYYTVWEEILLVFGVWAISFVISLVIWFVMERPLTNLAGLFMKWLSKGKGKGNKKRKTKKKKSSSNEEGQALYKNMVALSNYESVDGAIGAEDDHKYTSLMYQADQTIKGNTISE